MARSVRPVWFALLPLLAHPLGGWAAEAPKGELILRGHTGEVRAAAFGPDGRLIATGADDGTLRVWDATTGKEKRSIKGHAGLFAVVAFSPDGKRVIGGSRAAGEKVRSGDLKVWDAGTGKLVADLKGHAGQVFHAAFSPDGKRVAASCFAIEDDKASSELKVWDVETGKEALSIKVPTRVTMVTFSPDGRWMAGCGLAAESGKPGVAAAWDARTGKNAWAAEAGEGMGLLFSLSYSPDGKRLACGGEGEVRLRDADTGKAGLAIKGGVGFNRPLAFTPDSKRLICISKPWNLGFYSPGKSPDEVKVWEATTGKSLASRKLPAGASGLAISPDGKRYAAGVENTLRVWDVPSAK